SCRSPPAPLRSGPARAGAAPHFPTGAPPPQLATGEAAGSGSVTSVGDRVGAGWRGWHAGGRGRARGPAAARRLRPALAWRRGPPGPAAARLLRSRPVAAAATAGRTAVPCGT